MGAVTSITAARRQRVDPLESSIEKLLREARSKLIETGTRNRLIHTPRGGKRTRCLPIVNAQPDAVFVNLAREKKLLRLLAASGLDEAAPKRLAKRSRASSRRSRIKPAAKPLTRAETAYRRPSRLRCCKNACTQFTATPRPPRKSAASTSSFSPSDFCAGTRTSDRTRCARRR